MVSFQDLQSVDAQSWLDAGQEWLRVAQQSLTQADALHQDVSVPVAAAWPDSVGAYAAGKIDDQSDLLRVAAVECRAVSYVCRGLGHVLAICQHTIASALQAAASAALPVSADGRVGPAAGPVFPGLAAVGTALAGQIQQLIDHAVTVATDADAQAHDLLEHLAQQTAQTDPHVAENDDLGKASRLEIDIMSGVIPHGAPDATARWWASLSADDQQTLMLSSAGVLDALPGLPGAVRAALRGSTAFDRAATARWAAEHWNDVSDDPYKNNCTNFASDALHGGGLAETVPPEPGPDGWAKTSWPSWIPGFIRSRSATSTWSAAKDFYDFMTRHGAQDVGTAGARPGDIVVWEGPDGPHHAAVVTAVVDGDIRYTQHTSEQLNASLDGREPITENGTAHDDGWGQQKVHVLRVTPDWAP